MSSDYSAVRATDLSGFEPVTLHRRDPGPGTVRVAVEACGVCHSDVAGILNLIGHRDRGLPIVPGHEVIGRIEAIGEGVTGWAIGDRVGVGYLGGPCMRCANCRRGEFTFCLDQPVLGDTWDGGYAESVIVRATGIVAVPEGVDAAVLAPLMCAGLTVFTALRDSGARPGQLVAVQGIGGLGHLALQYAAAMGFRVAAIARGEGKRGLAVQLGAEHYIDSSVADPAAALQELGGAHAIIATAANGASMSGLVDGLAVRGRLVVVGVAADPIQVSTTSLIFGGRSVVGSLTGTPGDNADNLAFALAHGIAPIVERRPLADAGAAFARMMSGEARFRMVLDVVRDATASAAGPID
ncbi:alcohol dehydrogenase catalytic domain-containing protein [Leifsonia sp. AG29]|uniref:alcohol dehydrogenase catalytic domain-containing protein n=1 Tax=Leifsonia sp. AG29 TaxID=2598860 RepID=UPI00131B1F4B|nr:alcohol dehydrogenase catalytic domain-containing protein [Leifsonia sp. AG29]